MARRKRKTKPSVVERLLFGEPTVRRRRRKKQAHFELELDQEVQSAIWGIVFMTIGALILLSFFDSLGIFSVVIKGTLAPVLGWGLYIIPFLLIAFGLLIFTNHKIKLNIAKLLGISLFFVSLLSILHLTIPTNQIATFAREGTHGGFIGFGTNYLIRDKLAIDAVAAGVIFVSMFLVAAFLTFEGALFELIKLFKLPKISIKTKKKKAEPKEKKRLVAVPKTTKDDDIAIIKPAFEEPTVDPEVVLKKHKDPQQKLPIDQDSHTLESKVIEWEYPPMSLLEDKTSEITIDDKKLRRNAEKIRQKLEQFGIKVVMKNVHVGPTVVQYTLKPDEGVKLSKITSLKNDLALALAAQSLRLEAPIPGKSLVGIEVPSEKRTIVYLREIMASAQFQDAKKKSRLICPLGRNVSGSPVLADLSDMPHLLIAGATGSGKSVGMNTILVSLLYHNSPSEMRLILIDPKRVELADYNGIPHLLTPVVTDPEKAANALNWAVAEMNRRYATLQQARCRSIDEYNGDDGREQKMPKIVIVIDELADLMLSNGKEVEASICRIAQMARAVGIHLIIATQRPSVDVITGLIKANIPTRIAYAVTSGIDSRTIIDGAGAEDLLGKGDMLYLPKDLNKPVRVQGIYVGSGEIKRVTDRLKLTLEPEYVKEVTEEKDTSSIQGLPNSGGNSEDDLYNDAVKVIVENNKASASLLQRRLRIGYARAARILDLLEENGIVGPVNGAKPRKILISRQSDQ